MVKGGKEMNYIWKYPLVPMDTQEVAMPRNPRFLSVAVQGETPMLYALVNPDLPSETYTVLMRGTGHPVTEEVLAGYAFLGTVTTFNGSLVWHVFVERERIERR